MSSMEKSVVRNIPSTTPQMKLSFCETQQLSAILANFHSIMSNRAASPVGLQWPWRSSSYSRSRYPPPSSLADRLTEVNSSLVAAESEAYCHYGVLRAIIFYYYCYKMLIIIIVFLLAQSHYTLTLPQSH